MTEKTQEIALFGGGSHDLWHTLGDDPLHKAVPYVEPPTDVKARLRRQRWLRDETLPFPAYSEIGGLDFERVVGLLLGQIRDVSMKLTALQLKVDDLAEKVDDLAERPQERLTPISDLGSAEGSLRSPILVNVEDYEEESIARWAEIELTARGSTEPEALDALKVEIVKLHKELVENRETLGAGPLRWLAILDSRLSPKA